MRKILVAIAFALVSSLAAAQSPTQLYNAEEKRILQQMSAGSLSVKEAMIEMEVAGRSYFPDDALLNARNASYVRYAQQLDRGEIDFPRFMELVEQRKARFDVALAERNAADRAQQQAAAQEAQRQAESERNSNAMGNLLRSIGGAFQKAYPPQVTCNSVTIGAQTNTSCQ